MIDQVISGVEQRIADDMLLSLNREFLREEVDVALKQMSPFKAPGPDGFSASFYQDHWEIVGAEVSQAVLDLLSNGRLITDNIMVAYEMLHTMQSRQKSKVGSMAMKLDMFKVYDRVEWDYLEAMSLKLGFGERWTGLLMACVKSVSYSVKVNRAAGDIFYPSRGLRQGDPLSPYLFLICVEGLSSLLQQADRNGVLRGVATSKGGLRINYLLFADDCVIFCKTKQEEWLDVEQILWKYECASAKALITQSTNGVVCGNYNKYWGLPTVIGRSKYNTFRGIKEKIWRRICSWKFVLLSTAGKEILIKSVLQAIPAYTMSVFKLPCMLLKEIEAMFSRFWWDHNKAGKDIHWRSWEKLGLVKGKGGLGFRNLVSFNKALLAKQVWRLMQEPTSLVSQVFKHKSFPHCHLSESKIGSSPSHIWRSLWSALDLVKAGSIWRVGNGENIRVWHDRWLPRPTTYMVQTPINMLDSEARVIELINVENRVWNKDLIEVVFNKEDAELISSLPVSIRGVTNKLMWVPGKAKQFIWRALNDILPTKGTLARKKIVNEGFCPVCTKEVENVLHVGQMQKQQINETEVQLQARVRVLWEPAVETFYKFNFDAAYIQNDRTMGIGGVLRDHRGDAEMVLSAPKAHVPSTFHAECYALIWVMQLCHELRISNVIFEGDAMQVTDSINSNCVDCS
ncbi:uncharacterized protein LOC122306318 [Carya illinoinensis]|uniref:uncharacterized protein LOC122306318 n=1 Tax=Carya illinoinensis TaxID=32201 RepID=UPI001C71E2E4|nr:uncharacterized protein LOC122306318 [Carya illinoinensis]